MQYLLEDLQYILIVRIECSLQWSVDIEVFQHANQIGGRSHLKLYNANMFTP